MLRQRAPAEKFGTELQNGKTYHHLQQQQQSQQRDRGKIGTSKGKRSVLGRLGGGLKTAAAAVLFLVYGVVPVWYGNCTWVRRNFIYLNAVQLVPELNMTHPMASGLACGRNFYIRTEDQMTIGVWHAVPRSLAHRRCGVKANNTDEPQGASVLEEAGEFDDDRPVFLHFHGSGGTRGARHRVELHKMMTEKLDAHVVTFDYRGFGDSTPARPTVIGVVSDVNAVYRWLRRRVQRNRIHFWAQSLGTGIAVHLSHELPRPEGPVSVVLESPYTSIPDASREHPYTTLHTFFPFFDFWFVTPTRHSDTFFDSESRIGNVSAPVLILHAEDDDTIPYKLGKRLYQTARRVRDQRSQPVKMVTYQAHLGYGHKSISSDPALPEIVRNFMGLSTTLHSTMTH